MQWLEAGGRGRSVHRGGADGKGGVGMRRGPPGREKAWARIATDSCPQGARSRNIYFLRSSRVTGAGRWPLQGSAERPMCYSRL